MDEFQSFAINNQPEDNSRAQEKNESEAQNINQSSRRTWSFKEDNQLRQAVKLYGTNWLNVAQELLNRNPSQCAQRWKRIKPPNLYSKRKPWTKKEDSQLLKLFEIYKNNWVKISKNISNRTSKQVRERFINKLNPEINKQPFTEAEDLLIVEGFKTFGSQWCKISKMLQGRPENLIKNRFYSYIRKHYLKIDNPYYVIPQKNQELPIQFKKKNENIKDKTIKIPQVSISQWKFQDELDCQDIKKQQSPRSTQVSKKSKIKVKNMLLKAQDNQKQQQNFQDYNLLPSIKEEQQYSQNQVKEEPEEKNYQDQLQNKNNVSSQVNFYTNSQPFNPQLLYKQMYYYQHQIGMQYIPQYFLATPIIQYRALIQETQFSKSLKTYYGNQN
ncbi:unnamed protein product [Paramecium sonneborni]|uniref:Homeodomain protein n=1 Tax=Paramecium sonneborni TaxID=65129 RepID=A0A8S1L1J8_9CILI|nr:unnamed protein product [Paramecium sonneborni]CAD8061541.1 unnamed protein product [Paramecium sonneborni]